MPGDDSLSVAGVNVGAPAARTGVEQRPSGDAIEASARAGRGRNARLVLPLPLTSVYGAREYLYDAFGTPEKAPDYGFGVGVPCGWQVLHMTKWILFWLSGDLKVVSNVVTLGWLGLTLG